MRTVGELIDDLLEKRITLDRLKAQSPEVAEALTVAEDYHALCQELQRRDAPPVYFTNYTWPYWYQTGTLPTTSTTITLTGDAPGRYTEHTSLVR